MKSMVNCKESEQKQEYVGDLPSISLPLPINDVPIPTIKKRQQQNCQSSSPEETTNIATLDLSSSFMLMQNIDELLDYTENISTSSSEKLKCKYGKILERNRIANTRFLKISNYWF